MLKTFLKVLITAAASVVFGFFSAILMYTLSNKVPFGVTAVLGVLTTIALFAAYVALYRGCVELTFIKASLCLVLFPLMCVVCYGFSLLW